MQLLTRESAVRCDHDGRIASIASQTWVTVAGVPVLVGDDPVGRTIDGCPHAGPTIKPCARTLEVSTGHSALVRVDGAPVVLDVLAGLTDGTPPGLVRYTVRKVGQAFVSADR
ncbi:hypothetical protein [Cryptosporangium phraense]|uniref:Uncharacterized protein n=1 Tax=Cryptosporangium phraense TaxID=2593070 RepID=A0A545ARS6_9ACTN|nr:hypothetical protein [Cryptosporangium phraense]TQS43385.1 hypothetical protein FL583_19320 [Cryptosporangium phraense]